MPNLAYPSLANCKIKKLAIGETTTFGPVDGMKIHGLFSDGGVVLGKSRVNGDDFVKTGTYASGTGWTILGGIEVSLSAVTVTSGSVCVFYTDSTTGEM